MRILVVEDTFIGTARDAFRDQKGHDFVFATTYEEAMVKIDHADAVITDMFFPSAINWFDYLASRNPRGFFGRMDENPSGAMIMLEAGKRDLPIILASAGNRHHGNLALMRYALVRLPEFKSLWTDPVYNTQFHNWHKLEKSDPQFWLGVLAELTREENQERDRKYRAQAKSS